MTVFATIDALLDTLVPGQGAWPAAGALGLGERVQVILRLSPGGDSALSRVLEALPSGFSLQDQSYREAKLRDLEARFPDAFERVVTAVYTAYYISPKVRSVLAAEAGFSDHPPQPLGHALPPFDTERVARSAARPPFWREDGT